MEGTGGAVMGVAVPRFAGWLSYDGTAGLVMRDLDVDALGGGARLAVDVPPAATHRPVRIRGPVREADGEGLVRMIFGWGEMRLGTAATGEVDVSWPRGKTRLLSGRIGVDLAERADGRFALSGRLDWRAEDGRQTYERAELRGPGMSGRVSGEVDAEDRARLEVEGTPRTSKRPRSCSPGSAGRSATPRPSRRASPGAGTFRGLLAGHGRLAGLRGPLRGRARRLRRGRLGPRRVGGHPRHGGGGGRCRGRSCSARTRARSDGKGAPRSAGSASGTRSRAAPAPPRGRSRTSSRSWSWDVVATGLVTGEAQIRGRRSAPAGRGEGHGARRPVLRDSLRRARIESRWKGRLAEVTRGEVRLGGGTVAFRGSVTDDGVYDGSGEMEGVDLGALAPSPVPGAAFGGRLSGRLEMQGTLTRPRLRASLSSPRLFLGDEGIGALEARLAGTGDGRVAVDGRCRSARVDLALAGGVGAAAPYAAELTLSREIDEPRPLPPGAPAEPSRDARPRGLRAGAPPRPLADPGRDPGGGRRPRPPGPPARASPPGQRARAAHVLRRPARARRPPPGRRGDRPRGDRRGRTCWARGRLPCPLAGRRTCVPCPS